MASVYPGALDSFANPGPTDSLDTPGVEHDVLHAHANDAIGAVQAELGVNPSGSAASVAARLDGVDASLAGLGADPRVFDAVSYGAVVDGVTDDTAAWQAAINACAAAGGGVVTSSRNGVSVIAGALQDTTGANAQLLLPAVDYVDGEPITVALIGLVPAPSILSVIGATVAPDNHLVLKSTLASGTGAVVGAKGPSGTFGEFTSLHLHLENLTVRTVANPTITCLDLHRVACVSVGRGVVVDTGSYDVDGLAQPTSSGSYGVRLPGNNNGAQVDVTRLDVVGFYTGIQHSEHLNADHLVTWGCRVGLESNAANHASHINRFMAVHCTTPWKAVGGACAVDIEQFDLEHANSTQGWRQTTNDIDDASNFLTGAVRWWAVLAGTGAHNSFTKNGATGVTATRVGATPSSSSSLTVQDENGTITTGVTQIDFQGAGVTATAGTGEVVVTIPGGSGGGSTVYVYRDRLTATAGQSILTLGAAPVANSPLVWKNGTIQWPGTDYTISGSVITFGSTLSTGDVIAVKYDSLSSTASASALSGAAVNIQDNFNRANSTNSLGTTSTGGATWVQGAGTWGISSNQAYESSGVASVSRCYVESGVADCTVSVKLYAGGGAGGYSGLMVRQQAGADSGVLCEYDSAAGVVRVSRRTAGANTSLGSAAYVMSAGEVMSVVLSGSSVTLKMNGVTKVTATEATYAANTKHGLWTYPNQGSFDDFSIQP